MSQALAVARLVDRSVLRLRGRDTVKFLQGLTTKDLSAFDSAVRPAGRSQPAAGGPDGALYTAFLNNKGKVCFDAFVLRHPGTAAVGGGDVGDGVAAAGTDSPSEPDLLLDCHAAQKTTILRHLKMYKLRAKVDVCDVSDEFAVWSLFGPSDDAATSALPPAPASAVDVAGVFAGDDVSVVHASPDPRLAALGQRVVVAVAVTDADADSSGGGGDNGGGAAASSRAGAAAVGAAQVEVVDHADYTAHRMGLGVAEGAELAGRMPLECNLESLQAVSFDKGCYVGQELVARTHYKGTIRKRVMPFVAVGGDSRDGNANLARASVQDGGDGGDDGAAHWTLLPSPTPAGTGEAAAAGDDSQGGKPGGRSGRGRAPARVIAVAPSGSVGLAMVRLEALSAGGAAAKGEPCELRLDAHAPATDGAPPTTAVPVCVRPPSWWPEEYLEA